MQHLICSFLFYILVSLSFNTNAQYYNPPPAEIIPNAITTASESSAWEAPDEISIIIQLTEYVHTDPQSQESTSIELGEVKSNALKKLKKFNVKLEDMEFLGMNEANSTNNGNFYGTNYNTTQKRLLSASYKFKWNQTLEKLDDLFIALRINGVNSVATSCEYSDQLKSEIKARLLEKCIANCNQDANTIASQSNVKLGQITSITSSITFSQLTYITT